MSNEQLRNGNDLSLKLFVVLSRANRAVTDRVVEDIKCYGLNLTEFAVLELLFHKGDQPIQHIGKQVLITSGSITYVVDKLEEKGLLLRKRCDKDGRVFYATMTVQGRELMNEIFPRHHKAIQHIFAGIDDNEKELLINLLKKLGIYAQDHN
jgi:MarR family 2-MHQ and catechol resistance regulon transcriptional repressor